MTQLLGKFFRICIMIYVFVFAYQWWKPLPELMDKPPLTHAVPASGVHFYADYTYLDKDGKRLTEQHIWDQIFTTIDNAKHSVFLDMFLYNDFQGRSQETTRPLSRELTERLIAKKAEDKHIAIALITDPINTVYGGVISPNLEQLSRSGIFVQMTDLMILPDSNLWWSAFWRPFLSWSGNDPAGGWVRHPFQYGGSDVPLRSWFALFNFKANHRKLIVADEPIRKGKSIVGQKMTTIVTSSNPHDASSAHGNVALKVDDQIWQDVFASENLLAHLSGGGLPNWNVGTISDATGTLRVTLLREKWIRERTLSILDGAQYGDRIDIAMFYLSDRSVIKALKDAATRGVHIRLILDPNKDAFGFEKNGIPNRPVAKELIGMTGSDIEVRWCDTHGEQCHAKLLIGKFTASHSLLVGSANFTRRNIGGYNLEASILAEGEKEFTAWQDAEQYFERLWNNRDGQFTVDYTYYEDTTFWKAPLYRMMERTGLSSF